MPKWSVWIQVLTLFPTPASSSCVPGRELWWLLLSCHSRGRAAPSCKSWLQADSALTVAGGRVENQKTASLLSPPIPLNTHKYAHMNYLLERSCLALRKKEKEDHKRWSWWRKRGTDFSSSSHLEFRPQDFRSKKLCCHGKVILQPCSTDEKTAQRSVCCSLSFATTPVLPSFPFGISVAVSWMPHLLAVAWTEEHVTETALDSPSGPCCHPPRDKFMAERLAASLSTEALTWVSLLAAPLDFRKNLLRKWASGRPGKFTSSTML